MNKDVKNQDLLFQKSTIKKENGSHKLAENIKNPYKSIRKRQPTNRNIGKGH